MFFTKFGFDGVPLSGRDGGPPFEYICAELGPGVGAERQRFIPYKKRFLYIKKRFLTFFIH